MALIDEIELKSKEIITDSYSMSVGEVISMYNDGDLDIHPEFQASGTSDKSATNEQHHLHSTSVCSPTQKLSKLYWLVCLIFKYYLVPEQTTSCF